VKLSGILGVIHPDGRPVDPAALRRAAGSLASFGPNVSAAWHAGRAGLAHAPLHCTPESLTERQPLHDPQSGLTITADARLDNRADLLSRLGLAGRDSGQTPDSTLILEAYRKWGEACVTRLLGDFAFAIWDATARRLFCARDPLGLRPFYYFHSARLHVFASSVKGVLGIAEVPASLNRARVADYLVQSLEGSTDSGTFFHGVQRLPPAHTAVLQDGELHLHRYWDPSNIEELRMASDREYLECFGDLFRRAVKDRLRCQAPVAAMLSGGLDSSTIVAVARDLQQASSGTPLDVFSAVADDPDSCTETAFVRAVIEHGGLNPHCLARSQAARPNATFVRAMAMAEEPWESMNIMLFMLYEAASANGHVVLLDGVDGDLVASLPESYPAALLRQGRLVRSWQEHRRQRENYYRSAQSLRPYLRLVRSAVTPSVLRRLRQRLSARRRIADTIDHSLISRAFAADTGLAERLLRNGLTRPPPGPTGLRHACIDRVTAPYLAAANERGCRIAAAFGVEPRKPFLDQRVVEFCIALPWDQKARHGWSKFLVRRLAETVLPESVAWRRGWEHVGWSFTVAHLQSNRRRVLDVLERNREALGEFVDMAEYSRLLDEFRECAAPVNEKVRVLYGLACWLENNAPVSI
jgi:asparagine synthase (glutamine-hydrolysing)